MAEYIDIVLLVHNDDDAEEVFVGIEAPMHRSVKIGESIKDRNYRRIRVKLDDIRNA